MKTVYLISLIFLTSCTYSVNLIHTQGQATDVLDSAQTPSTSVSPNIAIPASLI